MVHIQNVLKYLPKLSLYSIAVVCIFIIMVFVLLSQYSHPAVDDFCVASKVNDLGFVNHLQRHYLKVGGRYSGNAIYALFTQVFDLFKGYFLVPLILLAALGMAVAFLISTIFKIKSYNLLVILSVIAFLCIYLLGMTRVSTGIYWMAGALTYQGGNILFVVLAGLSIRLYDRQINSEQYRSTLLLLLLVCGIVMGLNETILLATAGFIVLANLLLYKTGSADNKPWLIMLFVTLICFCIVYFAPGNDVRSAHFPLRNDFIHAISGSWDYGVNYLKHWSISPILISSSILATFLVSSLYSFKNREFVVTANHLVFLFIVTLLTPFIFSFPAWWAMGVDPPYRTSNTIYFLFILSWFLTIAALTIFIVQSKVLSKLGHVNKYKELAIGIVTIPFLYYLLMNGNFKGALDDLRDNARHYDQYLNERYKAIEESLGKGVLTLVVPKYSYTYPTSIYFDDITNNPEDWRNTCYSDYFGLDNIRKQ